MENIQTNISTYQQIRIMDVFDYTIGHILYQINIFPQHGKTKHCIGTRPSNCQNKQLQQKGSINHHHNYVSFFLGLSKILQEWHIWVSFTRTGIWPSECHFFARINSDDVIRIWFKLQFRKNILDKWMVLDPGEEKNLKCYALRNSLKNISK